MFKSYYVGHHKKGRGTSFHLQYFLIKYFESVAVDYVIISEEEGINLLGMP
jgi:hypothetical protein